jgi:hypothetical protein
MPRTPAEWVEASELAAAILQIEDTGPPFGWPVIADGGPYDLQQAQALLDEARDRGFHPRPNVVAELVEALLDLAQQ